jgi:hypothetical protein
MFGDIKDLTPDGFVTARQRTYNKNLETPLRKRALPHDVVLPVATETCGSIVKIVLLPAKTR